jgi:hypothetical protein
VIATPSANRDRCLRTHEGLNLPPMPVITRPNACRGPYDHLLVNTDVSLRALWPKRAYWGALAWPWFSWISLGPTGSGDEEDMDLSLARILNFETEIEAQAAHEARLEVTIEMPKRK